MDQGVLESLKCRYRREELIFRDEEAITDFLKTINMLTISNLIAACWDEIPAKTLQLSWRKIIPPRDKETETTDTPAAQTTEESATAAMQGAAGTEEQVKQQRNFRHYLNNWVRD